MENLMIRPERKEDYPEIYTLVKRAFAGAEHADGTEQDLVNALRGGDSYIPMLSLVACRDDRLIGHIMFTKAHVGGAEVLALAPLSVLPEFQRKGVGKALVHEGHRIARQMGYPYSVVLGSEFYYPKFGYTPAVNYGIQVPDGMPSENFMAVKLDPKAEQLAGDMEYAKEFGL